MIKEKIIVLGANGFLGVHLCDTIIKNNYEVIALVRNKKSKNLHKLNKKGITVDFIGDLFEKKIFKKTNVVYAQFQDKNSIFWGRKTKYIVKNMPLSVMEVFLIN